MLLRQFSSNRPLALALLPVLAVLVAMPLFWDKGMPIKTFGFPIDVFTGYLTVAPWISGLAVVVLIFSGGLLCNMVFNRNEFYTSPTYMPSFMYIMIAGTLLTYDHAVSLLVANLFLLLGLSSVLEVFRQTRVLSEYFQAGFWMGIAALVYPPYVTVVLGLWVSIFFTRAFNWREHMAMLLAFGTPFLYWVVWKFYWNQLSSLVLFYNEISFDHRAPIETLDWTDRVFLISVGIALIVAIPRFLFSGGSGSNKSRNVRAVFFIVSVSLFASVLVSGLWLGQWVVSGSLIPMTFILGYWFANYRVSLIAPFVFYGLIAASSLMVLHSCGIV
jgi:Family of unknown function (DUF6427)